MEGIKKDKSKKHFNKKRFIKKKFIKKNSIYEKYALYKKNRIKLNFTFITSNSSNLNKKAKIAIIIPYRNREEHLQKFYEHFKNEHFDVYVIEQCDSQKFNRGLLLNAGFQIASNKKNYDYYIFHDVDSFPDQELMKLYYYKGNKIIHYASPYLGYKYTFDSFFGGITGMDKETFIKINGFPNFFYGWGGEDDALYNHIALANYKDIYRPQIGSYLLLEHNRPTKIEINKKKVENILKDIKSWQYYGYNDVSNLYVINHIHKYDGSNIFPMCTKKNIKNNSINKSSSSKSSSKDKLKIKIYQITIPLEEKLELRYNKIKT